MKKAAVCGFTVLLLLFCVIPAAPASAASFQQYGQNEDAELYRDMSMTLLLPYLQQAVDDYYSKYFEHSPNLDLSSAKILSAARPNGNGSGVFLLTLQLFPYFGPYIDVGVDNVTLSVQYGEEPLVVSFQHIQSNELPWNYQDEIKEKWPPE